jgi:hypothetical protein
MFLLSVRDDLELPYDSEEVPKPNRMVSGSIPGCKTVSLYLMENQLGWSSALCIP